MSAEPNYTRRHFLMGAAVVGGGLYIGLQLASRESKLTGTAPDVETPENAAPAAPPFAPNAFVRVGADNGVTVIIGKSEMGQGVYTSLAMLVAEELDIDVKRIQVQFAPVDPAYNSTMMPIQFTGGSSSVRTSYDQLRKAGATARAMLIAAAAKQWNVDPSTLTVDDGVVSDGSRSVKYGELIEAVAQIEAPKDVPLKDPKDFKVIGKSIRRLDGLSKVTGRAEFGLDVQQPDMLYAMVARAPVFGSTVAGYDDKAARAIRGVYDIKVVPTGVAVLATNTWAARRGRDALEVKWNDGPGSTVSTSAMREEYRELASKPGTVVESDGDVEKALAGGAKVVEAEYEVPYLSHSCMEPLNCTVHVTKDRCDLWLGTQMQSGDRQIAAAVLGFKPEQVHIHTTFLGGGFGRRGSFTGDVITEAVLLAKGVDRPIKVVWTREDDTKGGAYRPFFIHRIRGAVNEKGRPVAWKHTIVGQSILAGTPLERAFPKPDPMSREGVSHMPYKVPNFHVEQHDTKNAVPVQFWRSVGHSATGFIVNGFIDELAEAGGKDPLELRREMLAGKPRHLAVLNTAAEKAGWGKPLPQGRARGIALQESFGSIVAEVAEVSVSGDRVRVHRVVCAADCGPVVNPDNVAAQIEGGIVYGLSAALHGAITLNEGRVEQSNFNDYPVLRMDEMPRVETHLLSSNGPMGGVGEISVPPIAPAVCNAIFAATGKRIRRLPIAASLADA